MLVIVAEWDYPNTVLQLPCVVMLTMDHLLFLFLCGRLWKTTPRNLQRDREVYTTSGVDASTSLRSEGSALFQSRIQSLSDKKQLYLLVSIVHLRAHFTISKLALSGVQEFKAKPLPF